MMMEPSINGPVIHACWESDNWWSRKHVLRSGGQTVASVHAKRSSGIAVLCDNRYTLKCLRFPAYITVRDAETDDLVARFCCIPAHGFLAEFNDGESFRLGWVNWWRREWTWTSDTGGLLLASRHPWLSSRIEMQVEAHGAHQGKWLFLAVLELAYSKLTRPWF